MQLTQILPQPTDRALLVGQTGCGKTTLAKYLLMYIKLPVLVFDWKGLIRWDGYHRFTSLKDLMRANKVKSIYAPNLKEYRDETYWETFFQYAFRKGKCQVYVDEVYAITKNDDIPEWYHACLTRGREKGISTFSSSQRPMRVPQVVLSEAEHNYVFFLKMKQDRQKIESMTGIDADRISNLSKRWFYYANNEGDVIGPKTLNIQTRKAS